ncbi:hypothetical protein BB558_001523 [Smittium angustum]|uniref:Uncharacterized protein n=1 Tax=Smittium angustum TaxID=133377 RepID=A0A2U1JB53_SMIAN|nr:hypothetical protein BB558_001523 [Smittium angustum]
MNKRPETVVNARQLLRQAKLKRKIDDPSLDISNKKKISQSIRKSNANTLNNNPISKYKEEITKTIKKTPVGLMCSLCEIPIEANSEPELIAHLESFAHLSKKSLLLDENTDSEENINKHIETQETGNVEEDKTIPESAEKQNSKDSTDIDIDSKQVHHEKELKNPDENIEPRNNPDLYDMNSGIVADSDIDAQLLKFQNEISIISSEHSTIDGSGITNIKTGKKKRKLKELRSMVHEISYLNRDDTENALENESNQNLVKVENKEDPKSDSSDYEMDSDEDFVMDWRTMDISLLKK